MKSGIHPKYGALTIQCVCGNVIETRSTTQGRIQVDICSSCHPFFTGKQKLIDTAGRIDRFKKKFGDKVTLGSQKKQKKTVEAPAKKAAVTQASKPLKQQLSEAKGKATPK